MIREIKFRVWDKNKKCFPIEGEIYLFDAIKGYRKNLIAEQYTGLKDKNGKEIYEGDILNTCCGKAKVYFDEEDCSYKLWLKHGTTMPLVGKKSHRHLVYEVIGNIHENKELLGGEE